MSDYAMTSCEHRTTASEEQMHQPDGQTGPPKIPHSHTQALVLMNFSDHRLRTWLKAGTAVAVAYMVNADWLCASRWARTQGSLDLRLVRRNPVLAKNMTRLAFGEKAGVTGSLRQTAKPVVAAAHRAVPCARRPRRARLPRTGQSTSRSGRVFNRCRGSVIGRLAISVMCESSPDVEAYWQCCAGASAPRCCPTKTDTSYA
jgi:hypothetical protein